MTLKNCVKYWNPMTKKINITFINETPELLSLLYDMDLLPEQVVEGSDDYLSVIHLTNLFKSCGEISCDECNDAKQWAVRRLIYYENNNH